MNDPQHDVFQLAIAVLRDSTGLQVEIQQNASTLEGARSDRTPDGVLRLIETGIDIPVEVKKNPQQANLGALIDQVSRLPGSEPGLLVADYINPRLAERLREAGVQFIDTAGNAYINRTPIYVLITGRKPDRIIATSDQPHAGRAFEPKGLLVTYAFLSEPSLVPRPYREIARAAGVSVGTVSWVINALKADRYLQDDIKTGKRRLIDYNRLLDRWVSSWPEKLRQKHFLGTFSAKDPIWWKHTAIQDHAGVWGGETAASLYTGHLNPQVTTIYLPGDKLADLVRSSRLSKAREHEQASGGQVLIYTPFWKTTTSIGVSKDHGHELKEDRPAYSTTDTVHSPELAPPLVVYADLIATGDPRNLETAQRLRDEYLVEPDRAT